MTSLANLGKPHHVERRAARMLVRVILVAWIVVTMMALWVAMEQQSPSPSPAVTTQRQWAINVPPSVVPYGALVPEIGQ